MIKIIKTMIVVGRPDLLGWIAKRLLQSRNQNGSKILIFNE